MKQSILARGFTLIEILVAISIIGILSSILFVSFDDARDNSRNKAMLTELKQVQLALEVYKSQQGEYPDIPGCGSGTLEEVALDSGCSGNGSYIQGLTPEFIVALPLASESANPNCDIEYKRLADGSWYKLSANQCLKGTSLAADDEMALCPSTCSNTAAGLDCAAAAKTESFAVYSLGGQCE